MTEAAKNLLDAFGDEPFFERHAHLFIGGTALSWHLKHRLSEDLDFLMASPKLPKEELEELMIRYQAKEIPFAPAVRDTFANEGGMVEEYHRRFWVRGVKVDFLAGYGENDLEEKAIEEAMREEREPLMHGRVRVAGVTTLAVLKSLLMMKRTKIRDYYDMETLFQRGVWDEGRFLETVKGCYVTYDDIHILKLIRSRKQPLDDELLGGLVAMPPSFETLREKIAGRIETHLKDRFIRKGRT